MASVLFTPGTSKISEQYLPTAPAPVAQDLASVLAVGNQTGGITIQANTPAFDGEMTTDILNVTELKPLGFPLNTEIGIQADAVFPTAAKIRFQDEAVIQSDTNVYKLVDVPQVGSALPNVLAYDPTTEQVFYQAVGAGATAVNNVDTPAGDTSLTIAPNTGNVKVSLPVVATAGTTVNPDSITIDDRGRVTAVVAGSTKVETVSAGTNISVSGTATDPVVNLDISSAVDINGQMIVNAPFISGPPNAVVSISANNESLLLSCGAGYEIVANSQFKAQAGLAFTSGSPLLAVGSPTPAGTVGQYLASQGPGATPAWLTLPTAVGGVSAGSNISITGTATAPVVNVAISSTLDMNSNVIQEAGLIIGNSSSALQLTPGTGQSLLLQDDTLASAITIPSGSTNVLINKDLDMTDKDITNVVDIRGSSTGDISIRPWSATENINLTNAGGTTKLQITDTNVNMLTKLDMNNNNITNVDVLKIKEALGYTPTISSAIEVADTYVGTLAGLTVQNKDTGNNSSTNIYISGDGATETDKFMVIGRNNTNYTAGGTNPTTVDGDSGCAYISNLNGSLSVIADFNATDANAGIHFGYDNGTKAISIKSDTGELSLGTTFGAGTYTYNPGTAGQVLQSQGAGLPPVWGSGGGSGTVNSVVAGTNISVSGTATDPVVNVDITADLDMADFALQQVLDINGSTTADLNIQPAPSHNLNLVDNIGNTAVSITTTEVSVSKNIDMNANYIQEVSNITGTNSAAPGGRVLTLSAQDGIGLYSSGVAKVGLDGGPSDLQIVVDNTTGSEGIDITVQNHPLYINGSAGLSGQVLQTQGAGLPPIWASVGGGGGTVTSVGSGTNISISGTATDPIVNQVIGQNIVMNNHSITSCVGVSGDSGTSILTLGDQSTGTHIEINASATNRITMNPDTLYLDMTGEIRLNNQPGSAGEVLTSQGAGLPPIWTAVAGGGVQNPMTSDLDANNFRITNLDEITPGTSGDLDIALAGLGLLTVKNSGTTKVSLGGPNVAVFDAGGTTFPAILNAPTALASLADTSIPNYKPLKEAFLNNAVNLDGSIDITEPAYVAGTLREKTISLPNIGAGTTYTTDPVKSITVDGKGRITSTSAYTTGPVESITAGTGISVGGTATFPSITNDGVLSVSASSGITIGGTPQNPTVQNDGVLTVGASSGITIGGTAQNPTVQNDGLLTATAGSGISVSPGQNPVIANTGILSATAGSGISISPGQNPSIANTGVLSLTAGSGISLSGSTGNITVSATGGGGSGNIFENSANNYSVAEASKTTISAGTIALGNNLANIVSAGTANTAIGQNTLSYAATPTGAAPQRCVALGSYAHQNAVASAVFSDTVVIGTSAFENAFGTNAGCVAIGHNAARSANIASGVCIGRFAGEFCNTGEDTIVGPYAARAVGGGFGNVAVGLSARDAGSTGSGNVCIGFQSGVNQQGDYNILIGAGVGQGGYGPATWTVSKTCCIGYQYDNVSTTGTDAFFMDMSDKTTANGGRAALWAASPSKVQASAACFQVAGDSIVSGIFQGAASRVKAGVVNTATLIPSTGYSTANVLSSRSFTYPYNHLLSSSSGTWKLKVSLKVSAIGINNNIRCYLELYNNTTAGTTSGFLFGTSYPLSVPHASVGGIDMNTISLEDVFSVGDFSQGDLIDINLYVQANSGTSTFTGGNYVFEYKLIQE